jgi:excisionase family DNA binding protein
MRLRPLSLTADSVAPASGDRARTSARKTTDIPKFLTIVQVAELLAVSTRTVRRWVDDELLVVHRPGRVVRISEPDLRAFLAEQRAE